MPPSLIHLATLCAAAYLLGAVPFGLLLGKWHGVDIRTIGSGNVGATNLSRALGRRWGILAFLLDFSKGLAPVGAARHLAATYPDSFASQTGGWGPVLVGLCAILGHVFPVYLAFRGGKGVATTFGVMAALSWVSALAAGIVWVVGFTATRLVSVASLAAAAALPPAVLLAERGRLDGAFLATEVFALSVAALIVARHRSNIRRLLRSEELPAGRSGAAGAAQPPPARPAADGDASRAPGGGSGPVLILGDGAWAMALSILLGDSGRDLRLWSHDPRYAAILRSTRRNPKFLPGAVFPEGLRIGSDIAELAAGARFLLSVVPTQFLRMSLERVAGALEPGATVVSCSKGIERATYRRPTEILAEFLPAARIAVLSGPSHAEEVCRRLPAAVVAASADAGTAAEVQQVLAGPSFRVYRSADPVGVEIAAAAKNVIAVAAGISDGLGFGDNARAALITRGLHEIRRLGVELGGSPETFAGLSAMGDLIATCTSTHSRNHTVGFRVGRGEPLERILDSTEMVAEGVETTRSIRQLAGQLGVEVPITQEVHAVLFDGKPPRKAVEDLMVRESKPETL